MIREGCRKEKGNVRKRKHTGMKKFREAKKLNE